MLMVYCIALKVMRLISSSLEVFVLQLPWVCHMTINYRYNAYITVSNSTFNCRLQRCRLQLTKDSSASVNRVPWGSSQLFCKRQRHKGGRGHTHMCPSWTDFNQRLVQRHLSDCRHHGQLTRICTSLSP